MFDFLVGNSVQVGERHGGYAVFYIDADGYAKPDVVDTGVRSNEVYEDFTIADADILCMEVSFVAGVGIYLYSRLHVRLQGKAFTENQCASRLDKGGVVTETFKIGFACTVYIQMVGVCGGDDAHIRREPVKGTVEFVRFNHSIRAGLRQEQVCSVVFGNAAEESGTAYMRLVKQVCGHCTRGSLSMSAGNAKSLAAAGDGAQHLGAFVYLKTVFMKVRQLGMLLGDGRGVHNQCVSFVLAILRNKGDVFLVMYLCAFCNQVLGQRARRAVIPCYEFAFGKKIAYQRAHANAAGADEINGFYGLYIHVLVI